jgi:hypothetical protein
MLRKKCFAYLMIGIISFQLLPFKEVGRIFYGNQMIEEICETADTDGKSAEGNEDMKKNDLYFKQISITMQEIDLAGQVCLSCNKVYTSRLADDTPTRPPLYS